ncbi:Cytochrome c heme lyase subunit CcmL [hydrothermal vent metagenome]|uniref:Cytochrome c heme lyase subunit CcmL n=1 Tax=hydrothermal vent metagenome TaxID=652676 RepID=A0A3B0Z4P6_9ZZZZ
MKLTHWLLTAILLVGCTNTIAAGLEAFDFSGNVNEDRYKHLIAELRCLVCQNQSLADSDAGLAHDLRREVWELMDQGNSDTQITEFLVNRYGDFVLYSPPVKPATYILWYGPFALLAIGSLALIRTLKHRSKQTTAEFSAEERKRLQQALGSEKADGE